MNPTPIPYAEDPIPSSSPCRVLMSGGKWNADAPDSLKEKYAAPIPYQEPKQAERAVVAPDGLRYEEPKAERVRRPAKQREVARSKAKQSEAKPAKSSRQLLPVPDEMGSYRFVALSRRKVVRAVCTLCNSERNIHIRAWRNGTGRGCWCQRVKSDAQPSNRTLSPYCIHGHEMTPQNTYFHLTGKRVIRDCRECTRINARNLYRQRMEEMGRPRKKVLDGAEIQRRLDSGKTVQEIAAEMECRTDSLQRCLKIWREEIAIRLDTKAGQVMQGARDQIAGEAFGDR